MCRIREASRPEIRRGLLASPLVHFGAYGFRAFYHFWVKPIDDGRKADAIILPILWSTRERLVAVLEVMTSHEHGIVDNAPNVVHKTCRSGGLTRSIH